MKIKTIKKAIAMFSLVAVSVCTMGTNAVIADSAVTSLTQYNPGGSDGPVIEAKWEMNGPAWDVKPVRNADGSWTPGVLNPGLGGDDSPDAGAQIDPIGTWNDMTDYSICVIVTDPQGAENVDHVYANIFYPETIAFHPEAPAPFDDQINGGTVNLPDYGMSGCGKMIEQNELRLLTKNQGVELFCGINSTTGIYNNNNNLPSFFNGYDYYTSDYMTSICGYTGELAQERARVYCDDKQLTWEDPAGDYKVEVFAKDYQMNNSYEDVKEFNLFQYLPLVAFEIDFDEVNYGTVVEGTWSNPSGDLDWDCPVYNSDCGGENPETVRNIGNKRLYMFVEQDDFNGYFVPTGGTPDVHYKARVGNEALDYRYYDPNIGNPQRLEDILDLSEEEKMDFSIKVDKFIDQQSTIVGQMILSVDEVGAEFRQCTPN